MDARNQVDPLTYFLYPVSRESARFLAWAYSSVG
jgi:hypothetical protein